MNDGATSNEWIFWDVVEGLGEDLLPVVCKPGEPIHSTSNLAAYGKVPSRYTVQREVVGFTGWTSHRATERDLEIWSREPHYGICLQTRRIRALDFDITDRDYATYLQDCLELLGYAFPYRTRSNSSKFLTLFYLEGDYGKQTLQTPHGLIEFLATGQQCVVGGTHPSGVRYEWDWRHPIPTFGPQEFEELLSALAGMVGSDRNGQPVSWSQSSRSRVVERTTTDRGRLEDPVLDYLQLRGLVLRSAPDGRAFLRCPWVESHTTESDLTASCWFAAGTAGFDNGHYRCLHGHCSGREDWEFLAAIGYTEDGFEEIGTRIGGQGREPVEVVSARHLGPSTDESGMGRVHLVTEPHHTLEAFGAHETPKKALIVSEGKSHPLDLPGAMIRADSGAIKPLLSNLMLVLDRPDLCGAIVQQDSFTDELIFAPWTVGEPCPSNVSLATVSGARPFQDTDYDTIRLRLAGLGFGPGDIPIDSMRRSVHLHASYRTFDSAIHWLTHLPEWDRVPRIETFVSVYLDGQDTPYTRAVARYWWSAHAGRILAPGCQADMAVVLISDQGSGKTSSLKAIAPNEGTYVELNLKEHDDNLSRMVRGKLIGEIAELKGLKSRDDESIKAWVSRRWEEWIPKYCEHPKRFPRRLILCGTSNKEEFLADETGNRRWLPLMLGTRQRANAIERDREQLWAEATERFLTDGIGWSYAELLAKDVHIDHLISDAWDGVIAEWLSGSDGFSDGPRGNRPYIHVTDILKDALGFQTHQITTLTMMRLAKILSKFGYVKFNKKIDGIQYNVWKKKSSLVVE